MPDRFLVLGKLDLVRQALLVALQHTEILRHGVEQDDVDAITRGRWGLDNSVELVHQLSEEIDRELPDWRPPQNVPTGPDGYSGGPDTCRHCLKAGGAHHILCPETLNRFRHAQPDAHLGAVE